MCLLTVQTRVAVDKLCIPRVMWGVAWGRFIRVCLQPRLSSANLVSSTRVKDGVTAFSLGTHACGTLRCCEGVGYWMSHIGMGAAFLGQQRSLNVVVVECGEVLH